MKSLADSLQALLALDGEIEWPAAQRVVMLVQEVDGGAVAKDLEGKIGYPPLPVRLVGG